MKEYSVITVRHLAHLDKTAVNQVGRSQYNTHLMPRTEPLEAAKIYCRRTNTSYKKSIIAF